MSYDGIVRLDARIFKVDLGELVKFILNHPVDATLDELVVMKWKPAKWEPFWSQTFGHQRGLTRQSFLNALLVLFTNEEEITRDLMRWLSNELCFHPTWIVTDPFFEPVVTEFVPMSKKRKEPEPDSKYVGTVVIRRDTSCVGTHWFMFDSLDDASDTLNAIERIHFAHDQECETECIELAKIKPFKSKDMLNIIENCAKK